MLGLISDVSSASFSSAMSFFVTERVTRVVVTLELSLVTVVVVVEDSSTFFSAVRPFLGERRLGVTTVCCCVTFSTRLSSDDFWAGGRPRPLAGERVATVCCCVTFSTRLSSDDFWAGGRPRLLAGDRDRERDLRAGERDLLRDGEREGEVERDRNGRVFCKRKRQKLQVTDKKRRVT